MSIIKWPNIIKEFKSLKNDLIKDNFYRETFNVFLKGQLVCKFLLFIIFVCKEFKIDLKFNLMGFSMGGLVTIYQYLHCENLHKYIQNLVTLNSPLLGGALKYEEEKRYSIIEDS